MSKVTGKEKEEDKKVKKEEKVKSEEKPKEDTAKKDEKSKKPEEKLNISQDELKKLKQEKEEYLNSLQRLQAEFTNYRKRVAKEKDDFRKYALETFALEILLILDNFERALQSTEGTKNFDSLFEGIKMIEKQFKDWLKSKNITEIEVMDKEFDPNFHQAMGHEETSDCEENTIIKELQKGYLIKDKVLRPSLVMVAKKAEPLKESSGSEQDREKEGD